MKFPRRKFLLRSLTALGIGAILGLSLGAVASAQTQPYDLLLRNARIVDGTGNPSYLGDVAIRGDTIARIAPSTSEAATRVIDLGGLVLAPGFIDVHTHASRGIFEVPTAGNYLRQGVTTIMEGPDGRSPIPLAPFLAKLSALPKSVNIGTFIGQGSVREAVIGEVDRRPSAAELDRMRALVEQGMKDGAFGLSSGLFYVPGIFTQHEEVAELAKVAGRLGGYYNSHMRDEASRVVESVKETIAVGEQGGLPTQVSHHKVIGTPNWGRSVETLRLIDEARARGVDATIDQYPYTASSTSIQGALVPAWVQEGGRARMLGRLKDPVTRAKAKVEIAENLRTERGGGDLTKVVITVCEWNESLAGKNLAEVTKQRGMDATMENGAETVMWLVEQGLCRGVYHVMDEEDLERILRHPATMIASDGEVPLVGTPRAGMPHPRSYGTFVRVLARYVRERKTITLEDAVRKMSSFPAQRLGLMDRGVIRPGLKADLVVFDPALVRDTATFEQPHQYAEGVPFVIVNGQIAVEQGAITAARPGKVLYGLGKAEN